MTAAKANKELVWETDQFDGHMSELASSDAIGRFNSLRALDKLLDGVHAGLTTVIGAGPGTGKTTLANQMALDLASQGVPTIYVSNELPGSRIVQKGVACIANGKLTLDDCAGTTPSDKVDDLKWAQAAFKAKVASNLCIVDDAVNTSEIDRLVGDCIHETGKHPALILDYLQMQASMSNDASSDERTAIANTFNALVKTGKAYRAPVFVISSIARAAYSKADVGLDVFGGCQGIEYGADNAIYLTVDGKTPAERKSNMERAERPIVLSTLKVRYGAVGSIKLTFDAPHALFTDRA